MKLPDNALTATHLTVPSASMVAPGGSGFCHTPRWAVWQNS